VSKLAELSIIEKVSGTKLESGATEVIGEA